MFSLFYRISARKVEFTVGVCHIILCEGTSCRDLVLRDLYRLLNCRDVEGGKEKPLRSETETLRLRGFDGK